MEDGTKFCPECGTKVVNSEQDSYHEPPRDNSKIYLGIVGGVLLLAGIGFGIYSYAGHKDQPVEVAEQTVSDGKSKADSNTTPSDPIRANISAGLMTDSRPVTNPQKWWEIIQGDWYDEYGNKLVTVQDNNINGCEIVSVYDIVGGGGLAHGTFRLRENEQEWDVKLSWNIRKSSGDSLSINGNLMLHKAKDYYYESIDGIHLGMSPEAVKQKLGEPTQILDKDNPVQIGDGKYYSGWCYKDKGLIISFTNGGADRITLPNGSKLRFDKSGLNCSNSPEEFAKAYSMHSVPQWQQPDDFYTSPCGIGNGEYLYFGKNMRNVTLTVYFN